MYVPFNAPHNSSSLDPEIRSSVQAPDEFKERYPPVEVIDRRGGERTSVRIGLLYH